jgi:CRP/FNR family transcriptional regulator
MLSAEAATLIPRHMPAARPLARVAPASHTPGSLEGRVERSSTRTLAGKEHVFCEGDLRSHVFQLEQGVVIIYRMLPDGRRQVFEFAYPGDFIGLGAGDVHMFSAETTGTTRVRCIPAAMLEEAAKHEPELALSLYRAVSLELSAARDLLIAIGQRSAIERVATFLLMLHRRLNRGDSSGANMLIDLPMRRADIADLLGLTIETVSRTITKLRTMGVIKVAHASAISITDLDRLEELAAGE